MNLPTGLLLLTVLLPPLPLTAAELEPLRLTLAPATAEATSGEECEETHSAHGGRARGEGRPQLESEHRPLPQRTYHLNEHRRRAEIKAHLRRPDGSVVEPELILGANPRVHFPTPLGDGPTHGAHNLYVVEQGVDNGVLVVRSAKWITMHHSCGWGHDRKFDSNRVNPQPLALIPFEILIDDLWNSNFHARVQSGDNLRITVLSFGEPVAGAEVTLTTEQGWSKRVISDESGIAVIQLARDYYPPLWAEFKRNHRGPLLVTARYRAKLDGEFRGEPYERVSYLATHPWVYSPPSRAYASYAYGLLIAALMITVGGAGTYYHRERRRLPHRGIVFD